MVVFYIDNWGFRRYMDCSLSKGRATWNCRLLVKTQISVREVNVCYWMDCSGG